MFLSASSAPISLDWAFACCVCVWMLWHCNLIPDQQTLNLCCVCRIFIFLLFVDADRDPLSPPGLRENKVLTSNRHAPPFFSTFLLLFFSNWVDDIKNSGDRWSSSSFSWCSNLGAISPLSAEYVYCVIYRSTCYRGSPNQPVSFSVSLSCLFVCIPTVSGHLIPHIQRRCQWFYSLFYLF